MVNSNPLGSPWDAYATLTQGNIDAAGMGHDEFSEYSDSESLEEVLKADEFSDTSDSDSYEVLIAEEVFSDEEEVPVAPAPPVPAAPVIVVPAEPPPLPPGWGEQHDYDYFSQPKNRRLSR
jgi:hypothetical protein